jgi:hypothetical protein
METTAILGAAERASGAGQPALLSGTWPEPDVGAGGGPEVGVPRGLAFALTTIEYGTGLLGLLLAVGLLAARWL